jgi:hypothetical protein
MHNASYVGGFVGGLFLMAWVWWTRIKMADADRQSKTLASAG